MLSRSTTTPSSWLAFELSVLHRHQFSSIAIPFTGDPGIGRYLKRRGVSVFANDPLRSDWLRSLGAIQNSTEQLSDDDINLVLEDVYVPGHRLRNEALRDRFSEIDSWWFDNIRSGMDRLDSSVKFALCASIVFDVGDYVHSFDDATCELRQPLSNTFRRLWTIAPEPIATIEVCTCSNKTPDDFIAETAADIMFLRLPAAELGEDNAIRRTWSEEWVRGERNFWSDHDAAMNGHLGSPVTTKSHYLRMLDESLSKASHLKQWAVSHIETGFLSTQEIADMIGRHRRVEAVYSKDFTELTGKKAVILTA